MTILLWGLAAVGALVLVGAILYVLVAAIVFVALLSNAVGSKTEWPYLPYDYEWAVMGVATAVWPVAIGIGVFSLYEEYQKHLNYLDNLPKQG